MKKFWVIFGATVVTALGVIAPGSQGQAVVQSGNILDRRAINLSLKDVTIHEALLEALINAGVPGGVAVSHDCGALPRHSLTPANPSLRGLLDAIVLAEPGYTWEVRDGVVNLITHVGLSPFLQTMVPRFEINGPTTPREALEKLLLIPEVRNQAERYLGSRLGQGGPYAFSLRGPKPSQAKKLSLKATNITVREALNSIARTNGTGVWMLSQSRCTVPNRRRVYSWQFFTTGGSVIGAEFRKPRQSSGVIARGHSAIQKVCAVLESNGK